MSCRASRRRSAPRTALCLARSTFVRQLSASAASTGVNAVTIAPDGSTTDYWSGVDTNFVWRASGGLRLSGGTSTGQRNVDTCGLLVNDPPTGQLLMEGRERDCDRERNFQTNLRGTASYTIPWVDVSSARRSVSVRACRSTPTTRSISRTSRGVRTARTGRGRRFLRTLRDGRPRTCCPMTSTASALPSSTSSSRRTSASGQANQHRRRCLQRVQLRCGAWLLRDVPEP